MNDVNERALICFNLCFYFYIIVFTMWREGYKLSDESKRKIKELFPKETVNEPTESCASHDLDIWSNLFGTTNKPIQQQTISYKDDLFDMTKYPSSFVAFPDNPCTAPNAMLIDSHTEDAHGLETDAIAIMPSQNIKSSFNNDDNCASQLIKSNVQNMLNMSVSHEVGFPDEIKLELTKLKELILHRSKEDIFSSTLEICSHASVINQLTTEQVSIFCKYFNSNSLGENGVTLFCHVITHLEPEIGYNVGVSLLHHTLYQLVSSLQTCASAILFNVAVAFSKKHSKIFAEGLLLPLIEYDHLGPPQLNFITRVLNNGFSTEIFPYILIRLLEINMERTEEGFIDILHSIIGRMENDISKDVCHYLCQMFLKMSYVHSKNLKFAKLLHLALPKCSREMSVSDLDVLSTVVKQNATFMKKTLEKHLIKLQEKT